MTTEKSLYDVFADDSFQGYTWAHTAEEAINDVSQGDQDNRRWRAAVSHSQLRSPFEQEAFPIRVKDYE